MRHVLAMSVCQENSVLCVQGALPAPEPCRAEEREQKRESGQSKAGLGNFQQETAIYLFLLGRWLRGKIYFCKTSPIQKIAVGFSHPISLCCCISRRVWRLFWAFWLQFWVLISVLFLRLSPVSACSCHRSQFGLTDELGHTLCKSQLFRVWREFSWNRTVSLSGKPPRLQSSHGAAFLAHYHVINFKTKTTPGVWVGDLHLWGKVTPRLGAWKNRQGGAGKSVLKCVQVPEHCGGLLDVLI